MIAAGAGRLGADDLGDLELALRVCCPHDGLELSWFRWAPGVAPDDPGIGRHWRLDLAAVPGAAGIEAQFHFADAVGSTEGDAAEGVLRSTQGLVVSGRIDA